MSTSSLRIAVVGTYRSGSTAIAGILHHLGVDMGCSSDSQYFEPKDLSEALRRWWSEPRLVRSHPVERQIEHLKGWVESKKNLLVGAKHPLMSLSAPQIERAWGVTTKFVWCKRPLEESIISLTRKGWWPDSERIQTKLDLANRDFFSRRPSISVAYSDTLRDPEKQVEHLAKALGIEPTESQRNAAVKWIVNHEPVNPTNSSSSEPQSIRLHSSKIVATVLSGNSESIVFDAVKSVVDWVDEVCLIDTGISDNTIDQAKSAARDKFVVVSYPWTNDFAAARNHALQVAHDHGAQWAFTVDTDERFAFRGYTDISDLKRHLSSSPNVDAWMVESGNGSYSKERIFRLPSSLRWTGKTHEAVVSDTSFFRQQLEGCRFSEVPKSAEEYRSKLERDLELLLTETQTNPLNSRWWFYLGQTLEGQREYEKAVQAYDRCIRLDGWDCESGWACYVAARCLISLQAFREAEEYCSLGMTRMPTSAELPWLAGWCCFQRGEIKKAISWNQIAIAIANETKEQTMIFRHVPAWYEAPYDVLRHAWNKERDFERMKWAEERFEKAKLDRTKRYPE